MRVDAFPAHATLIPGQPLVITVQVFNTSPVISAHTLRILGVDPNWVTLDQDQLFEVMARAIIDAVVDAVEPEPALT